jgi:hypothetical protein
MPSKTHGMSRSPEYANWCNMRQRCNNQKHPDFRHYGARGIRVCERWSLFENFLKDMGRRPFPSATVERKDTNGNYEPGNCVWATQKDQTRNKRNNRLLTVDGVTRPIAAWAEESKVTARTIWKRVYRGWPAKEAVTLPTRKQWSRKKLNYAN